MVALDFDGLLFDGSAAAAFLFEFGGIAFQRLAGEGNAGYQGDALALAPLGLSANPDDAIAGRARGALLAAAKANGLGAARAHFAPLRRVDQIAGLFPVCHGVSVVVALSMKNLFFMRRGCLRARKHES